MSTDRVMQIVVEHTRAARFAAEYAHKARVADTEEEAKVYIAKTEFYKKRVEELRAERIALIGR